MMDRYILIHQCNVESATHIGKKTPSTLPITTIVSYYKIFLEFFYALGFLLTAAHCAPNLK